MLISLAVTVQQVNRDVLDGGQDKNDGGDFDGRG